MAKNLPRIVCPSGDFITRRLVREEDGAYGACPKCGQPLVKDTRRADRQAERAKADLHVYEAHP